MNPGISASLRLPRSPAADALFGGGKMKYYVTMRMARAAERRADAGLTDFQVDFQESTALLGQLNASGDLRVDARQYLDSNGYPSSVSHVDAFVAEDRFLASAKNRPTLDTLLAALVQLQNLGGQVPALASPGKQKAQDRLAAQRGRAGLLAAAMVATPSPPDRSSSGRVTKHAALAMHIDNRMRMSYCRVAHPTRP